MPLTHLLIDTYGWRDALEALAVIQLPFCAGIPHLLLRDRETRAHASDMTSGPTAPSSIRPALANPMFWLLALSVVSYALMFTALVFNIIPMLREAGYTTAEAVAAYACIGPSQLAGRTAILTLERFVNLTAAGLIGTLFPVLAMVILFALHAHSPFVFVFAAAFGTGMGVKTIVQATAAPELLGHEAYGALQGALMFPVYLAQAGAPLLAAWIWQVRGDYTLLAVALLLAACVSAASFVGATRCARPRAARVPTTAA